MSKKHCGCKAEKSYKCRKRDCKREKKVVRSCDLPCDHDEQRDWLEVHPKSALCCGHGIRTYDPTKMLKQCWKPQCAENKVCAN